MMPPQQVMMPYVTTPTHSGQQYFNFVQPQMGNPQMHMCHPLDSQVNQQPLLKRCSSDESSVSSASSSILVMPALSPGYTAAYPVNYQTPVPDVQIQNPGEQMNDLRPTTQDNLSINPEQINLASEMEQNLRIMPRPRSVNVSPRVDGRNLAPMLKGDPVHGWGAQPRRHVPMVPPQYRYRRNPRIRSKKKYGYRSKQNKIEQVKGNLERKFGSRGILVPQDSLLRGRTVVRVHVKKYEPLCKIEEALSMIDNHPDISICRISLPVSMKNPFQMKGFLVYVQVEDLVQVQLTQAIFRLFAEFQKCEVALQSQSNNNNATPKVKPDAVNPRVSDTPDGIIEPKELEPIKEEIIKKSNLVLDPVVDDMQKLGSSDDGGFYPAIFGDSDDECDGLCLDPPGMMRKHSSVAAA